MDNFINFFNSSFFTGLSTILTGSVAVWVFYRQKNEKKVQAARILIQEIREAEEKISIVSEKLNSNATSDLPQVLPINNWKNFSSLFAKDFDQDQLKIINHFYNSCEIIQDMVVKQNNFFWVTTEERARVVQSKIADLILDNTADEEITLKMDRFSNHPYTYTPMKTINVIEYHISQFQNITSTPTGEKLKKFCKL